MSSARAGPPGVQGRRVVVPEGLVRPVVPGGLAEVGLQGPVQGVLPQPGVGGGEVPHRLGLCPGPAGRRPAAAGAPGFHTGRRSRWAPSLWHPGGGQLRLRQQPPVPQVLQVDEQGIPGEGGRAGVGGVPRPGGPHRQHLPPPLAGVAEKVRKRPGLPAQASRCRTLPAGRTPAAGCRRNAPYPSHSFAQFHSCSIVCGAAGRVKGGRLPARGGGGSGAIPRRSHRWDFLQGMQGICLGRVAGEVGNHRVGVRQIEHLKDGVVRPSDTGS